MPVPCANTGQRTATQQTVTRPQCLHLHKLSCNWYKLPSKRMERSRSIANIKTYSLCIDRGLTRQSELDVEVSFSPTRCQDEGRNEQNHAWISSHCTCSWDYCSPMEGVSLHTLVTNSCMGLRMGLRLALRMLKSNSLMHGLGFRYYFPLLSLPLIWVAQKYAKVRLVFMGSFKCSDQGMQLRKAINL